MAGRKPHKPDSETREYVLSNTAYGTPQEIMARALKIDVKTLKKHYSEELDTGAQIALSTVVGKLYNNCMKGDRASIFFYLKTRGGFKETAHLEVTGANGQPLQYEDVSKIPNDKLMQQISDLGFEVTDEMKEAIEKGEHLDD